MRRWRACLVGTVLVAGCGGSGGAAPRSDRAQIARAVRGYLTAMADSHAAAACDALTAAAQHDQAIMGGSSSCEAGAANLSRKMSDADRRTARAAKVLVERVTGASATAKVPEARRELPLEKDGGRWKIAGFEGDLHFTSLVEAVCVTSGLQAYDDHKLPTRWYREGKRVYGDYMDGVCRRAERRGLLKKHGLTRAQLAPIARQVLREMRRRGQIRGG